MNRYDKVARERDWRESVRPGCDCAWCGRAGQGSETKRRGATTTAVRQMETCRCSQ